MAEENTFLLERERRMAENKARLEAMGLPEMSAKMAAMKPVRQCYRLAVRTPPWTQAAVATACCISSSWCST